MEKNRFSAARMALLAVLLACSLALGLIERAIPLDFALPGVRLGLTNVAVLLALYLFPFPETLTLVLLKCALLALLAGSFTSFAHSLSGSLLSLCVMAPLAGLARRDACESRRRAEPRRMVCRTQARQKIGPVGVSVAGAVCHNIGQLLCASILMETFRVVSYLPLLLVTGAVTGAAMGLAAQYTLPAVGKIVESEKREMES